MVIARADASERRPWCAGITLKGVCAGGGETLFRRKKVGGGGRSHEGVAMGDAGDGGDLPPERDAETDSLLGREAEII